MRRASEFWACSRANRSPSGPGLYSTAQPLCLNGTSVVPGDCITPSSDTFWDTTIFPILFSFSRWLWVPSAGRPADGVLEARECGWHASPMLVSKLGGRQPTLDHRHQRPALARLEDELHLEREARAVWPGLDRVDDEAAGPVDDPKDVVVAKHLIARWPERHRPGPSHAKIALGLNEPAGLAVEGLLAVRRSKGVEH